MKPQILRVGATSLLVAAALFVTACDDITYRDRVVSDSTRVFNQVERLGNPLVSEVTLEKRNHGFHNDGTPATDRANFQALVKSFITGVAGRTDAHATALSNALLPDMIVVNVGGAPNTAGWLSYVFTPGAYGGRKLEDDVVDAGLMAIFGTLVTNDATGQANCNAGLCSDNVDPGKNNAGPRTTNAFPYLAAANQ